MGRAGTTRRMITYPTNRLIGVLDDPRDAAGIVASMVAAGVARDDVVVLTGDEGRDRLGRLGARPNALSRLVRFFQFVLMDQTPDFMVYEAALAEGRAVLAVNATPRERMLAVAEILARHGVHFVNFFGRFQTEEISLWRGEEPPIPDALRR